MQDNLARPLPRTLPEKPKTQTKAKPKSAKKRKKQKFRWRFAFVSLIYFALIMVVLSRYAAINEIEREISLAKNKFEQLESANISKKVDIQQSIDMEKIEHDATQRLGMVQPGKNQVVNIRVQLEDSAEMLAPQTADTNLFVNVMDSIKSALAYLH